MKKLLSLGLAIAIMVCVVPFGAFTLTASAESEEYTEGYYTYTVVNDEVTITSCDQSISGDVSIPSTLGGYPVVNIGDGVFYYCTSLESVTISNSVTSIGEDVFFGCNNLQSVAVDENNEYFCSIDGVLFNKDKSSILCYPVGKTSTSYTIPNGVTSIGKQAFCDCDSLEVVTILDSVTYIGVSAFYHCSNLTNITIPDSVTSIGDGAFGYCKSLASITIPDRVTSIGNHAFCDCDSLTSITIPDSITSIGYGAFVGCEKLQNIEVDDGNEYFSDIEGVLFNKDKTTIFCYPASKTTTSYSIPESVTCISDDTFGYCNSLEIVTIPDSITYIGSYAFQLFLVVQN